MFLKLLQFVLLIALGLPTAARSEPPAAFKGWVPTGWKLIRHASGDLDGDGLDDAALILERTNPANIHRHDGLGTSELNLNPRRLLVLLNGPSGWRKMVQTDRFLPSENDAESPCLADPLSAEDDGGVAIRRGLLVIDLHHWLSCGSWGTAHRSFSFRLEQGRLRLIGLVTTGLLRNTGEESVSSVNYLTGRKKFTETPMVPDEGERGPSKTTWARLQGPRTFYIDRMRYRCTDDNSTVEWCR